jgi:hypothetical protein
MARAKQEPVAHVDGGAFEEIKGACVAGTPRPLLEAMAAQLVAMREARRLVDADGVMVRDGKQNPIAHPCLELERQAQRQLAELMRGWVKR